MEENELDSRNILIDTKEKCFLCLESLKEREEEFEKDTPLHSGNLVSLLSIAHYLNINPGQLICVENTTAFLSSANLNSGKISNLFVNLCDECCPVVTRLSKLCLELEDLQIKLDHQLRSFYGALEESEGDADRSHQFRSGNSSLAETLRGRMRTECRRVTKMTPVLPKVVSQLGQDAGIFTGTSDPALFESSPPSPASDTPESSSPPPPEKRPRIDAISQPVSFQCNLCPSTFPLFGGLIRHLKACHSFDQQRHQRNLNNWFTCKLCSAGFDSKGTWMQHVQSECPHIIPDMANYKSDDRYNCPLCPKKIRVTETKRHKIMRHVDTLLTSFKLDHLTAAEFKEYCDHVFKVELLLCRKYTDSKGNTSMECSHCSKSYSSNYSTHNHLFLAHRHIMGKKLVELQKSTGLEEIRATNLPSSYFQNRGGGGGDGSRLAKSTVLEELVLADAAWVDQGPEGVTNELTLVQCTLCQRQMKLKDLKRHKVRNHVETLLVSSKAAHVSMTEFKLYCGEAFKKTMDSFEKVFDSAGKPGWKCGRCSKLMSSDKYLGQHLFREHREYMEERIVKIQRGLSEEMDSSPQAPVAKVEPIHPDYTGHKEEYGSGGDNDDS